MSGYFCLLLGALPLFGDFSLSCMSLKDAEEIAREYNKGLLIAKEGTVQAKERTQQAVSRWLPSIRYLGQFRGAEKKSSSLTYIPPSMPSHHRIRGLVAV